MCLGLEEAVFHLKMPFLSLKIGVKIGNMVKRLISDHSHLVEGNLLEKAVGSYCFSVPFYFLVVDSRNVLFLKGFLEF